MTLDDNVLEDYDKRFDDRNKKKLIEAKIEQKMANAFHPRFFLEDILIISKAGISPEEANQHKRKLTGDSIVELYNAGYSAKDIQRMEEIIKKQDRGELFTNENVKEIIQKIKEYKPRFNEEDRINLAKWGIDPEKANKFEDRFSVSDIIPIVNSYIDPEKINQYPEGFKHIDLIEFYKKKVPPEKVKEYIGRFKGWEIAFLFEAGVTNEQAKNYDNYFRGSNITRFVKLGCPPEIANKYLEFFESEESKYRFELGDIIADLFEINCLPEDVAKYLGKFDSLDIKGLFKAGCTPEQADKYNKKFGGCHIAELFKAGITPEQADKYPKKFHGEDIANLFKAGITPEESDKYPEKFHGHEILMLRKFNVPIKETSRYSKKLHARRIVLLHRMNALKSGFNKEKQDKLVSIIDQLYDIKDIETNAEDYRILNVGLNSIILACDKQKIAYKFAQNINKEKEIFETLEEEEISFSNIVEAINTKDIKSYSNLQVKYIKGSSLEEIIIKNTLPLNKIIKYIENILDGLIEMRKAGIWYHRDIRPANIMIDEEKDRAVIIDLGIATKDKYGLSRDNKRFGSAKGDIFLANDLTSLGQLIYYMATGEHIFTQSESMTRTFSDIKDEINDYRTEIYSDSAGILLEKHLQQVDENISDITLSKLIKSTLKSKNQNHKEIKHIIGEYHKKQINTINERFEEIKTNPSLHNQNQYLEIAESFVEHKRKDLGCKTLELAVKYNIIDKNIYHKLGIWYIDLEKYEEGKQILKQALKNNQMNIPSIHNLGLCYSNLGQEDKGFKIWEELIEKGDGLILTFYNMGIYYYRKREYNKTIEILERAKAENKIDMSTTSLLKKCYALIKLFKEGKEKGFI